PPTADQFGGGHDGLVAYRGALVDFYRLYALATPLKSGLDGDPGRISLDGSPGYTCATDRAAQKLRAELASSDTCVHLRPDSVVGVYDAMLAYGGPTFVASTRLSQVIAAAHAAYPNDCRAVVTQDPTDPTKVFDFAVAYVPTTDYVPVGAVYVAGVASTVYG